MAEDTSVELSPERWKLLRGYLASLKQDLCDGPPEDLKSIKLSVMIDVDGVTFLPAIYHSKD